MFETSQRVAFGDVWKGVLGRWSSLTRFARLEDNDHEIHAPLNLKS